MKKYLRICINKILQFIQIRKYNLLYNISIVMFIKLILKNSLTKKDYIYKNIQRAGKASKRINIYY